MSTRSERDRNKTIQEKYQSILSDLLKDEDNKYCVDCDAKGPRWASWNLGVFLCIRCAGIHRNLGVHISRVKSVNLDAWTAEQIGMIQEMGNSRARAVYEANIPDSFRRPQTDSALEAFIRAKYEQKKYIAKEWVPPKPKIPVIPDEKKEKKKSRPKANIQLSAPKPSEEASSKPSKPASEKPAPKPEPASAGTVDLLGLDTPGPSDNTDPFGDFLGGPMGTDSGSQAPVENGVNEQNSTGDDLFGENGTGGEKKSTKESILALYGSGGSQQQQAFNVPGGMYMPNQQPNMMGGQVNMGIPQGGMPAGMPQTQAAMMGGMQPVDIQTNLAVDPTLQYQQQQYQQQLQHQMELMQQQQAALLLQQQQQQMNMMMGGQMPGMQNPGMMPAQQQQAGMMMQQQGYMMQNAYAAQQHQQQQQHLNQVQSQLASMKIGQTPGMPGMAGYQQPGTVAAGAGGWGSSQPSGQTLSNNLWQ